MKQVNKWRFGIHWYRGKILERVAFLNNLYRTILFSFPFSFSWWKTRSLLNKKRKHIHTKKGVLIQWLTLRLLSFIKSNKTSHSHKNSFRSSVISFKFSLQQIGKDVQYSKMRNLPIHSSEWVKLRETKGMSERRILEGFETLDLYHKFIFEIFKNIDRTLWNT